MNATRMVSQCQRFQQECVVCRSVHEPELDTWLCRGCWITHQPEVPWAIAPSLTVEGGPTWVSELRVTTLPEIAPG